jgi:hypothetical protein
VLARLARLAADASARRVLPLPRIQRSLPADAALVLWVDVSALGEHWSCVVRRQGPPAWRRLPGSGKTGAWTGEDDRLALNLYQALAVPQRVGAPKHLIEALRRQRLDPLRPHLRAQGKLPAVRRLLVVPSGLMALVPFEALIEEFQVSYVPSGSLYARLREQHRGVSGAPLLAVGDPVFEKPGATLPEPPDHGAVLKGVLPGSNAARAGLRGGDVVLAVGGRRLESAADLPEALSRLPGVVAWWRDGKRGSVRLGAGPLGAVVDERSARAAVRAWRRLESAVVRGSGHQRLPGTRREVKAIERLAGSGTTLLGSTASEQELDRLAGAGKLKDFRLVHFATHGEIDWARPERSALILAQDRLPDALAQASQGKKVYDGRLTVATIRSAWRLDADLVVLSACQTGLGRPAGGDGLLGFAHAFLSRGARAVLLSRWKVEDTATALLMVRFYENLLGKRAGLNKGMGRAEALAEAKRWLRRLPRQQAETLAARHAGGVLRGTEGDARPLVRGESAKLPEGDRPFAQPFYWAAFSLVGDPD